jgi:soluble lytic murein transglycosylase
LNGTAFFFDRSGYCESMRRILFFLLFVFACNPAFAGINNDVQNWLLLRQDSKHFSFDVYARFIRAHPDWPESRAFEYKAEDALGTVNNSDIVNWFDDHPPLSDMGEYRYVQALEAVGNKARAEIVLREAWRNGDFDDKLQAQIWARYAGWLNEDDYEARLQKLLWDGNLDRAIKNIGMVRNTKFREIAHARIALQRNSSKALDIVDDISRGAREDNGVILDLARYYRQRGKDDKAVSVMAKRHDDVSPYEAQWWKERNLLARDYLEDGDFKTAYALAKNHGFSEGKEFAEAEWFSGWLAVTRLRQPQEAFKHFNAMYHAVKTPISIARAAYWAGISAEQSHQNDQARQWYKIAALHMNTFYGQLAGYALGNPKQYFHDFFAKSRSIESISTAPAGSDLIAAARILHEMGKDKEVTEFLRAGLREATDKNAPQAIIPIALELDSPSIALQAAKAAYDRGILVSAALFPRPKVPPSKYVEGALTLGIIRQESLFDRYAQSPVGARGLMQLMPNTARKTAQQSGISYGNDAQLFQAQHNMILGQAYLTKMLARYDGFVPLAAASYNGGPGNVDKWLQLMGDPRKDPYSWVDWVERIPFYETRNYVQRVWESYAVYQYLLSAR